MRSELFIGGSSAIGQGLKPYFPDALFLSSKDYNVIHPDIKDFGKADIVINLSGIFTENYLMNYHLLTKRLIEVNCMGSVNILADYLPGMRNRGYGRIIFFSSIYSAINVPGCGIYSASKAFIDKLVKIAALENADRGITVNSIQLGYTGIGMGESSEDNILRAKLKVGLKRFITMEEIARTINYIIDTEYLTGQNIRLDGGMR